MAQLLNQIDRERDAGLDVACDCYPYAAFSTGIGETTYDEGWLERYHCDYSACVPAEGIPAAAPQKPPPRKVASVPALARRILRPLDRCTLVDFITAWIAVPLFKK
jgi:hypothetical protein